MHGDLIEALGGATKLALELGLGRTAVTNWAIRESGIAWQWRPRVAQLAEQRGVALPAGFLDRAHPSNLAHAADKPQQRRAG